MYWPIAQPIRAAVMSRTTYTALTEECARRVVAACRILFTASRLNLRHRELHRGEKPELPELPPLGTRSEYEAWLRADQDYMNYRHDWAVFKAGYPPGHVLKYLAFPIYPGITPATLPDRSREYKSRCPQLEPGPPWDEVDLWPIPAEHREGVIHRLLEIITKPPTPDVALSATRAMLFASSVNLMYEKAGDIEPPYKPFPPYPPEDRDFTGLQFCDAQWCLFTQDRDLRDDGYPPGETFRWLRSPARMCEELVNWELVNKYMAMNGYEVGEEVGEEVASGFPGSSCRWTPLDERTPVRESGRRLC